jgi:hypothetical protein
LQSFRLKVYRQEITDSVVKRVNETCSSVIGLIKVFLFFFLPEYIDYVPSRDRERPTKLELALAVPPDSIVTVNLEFDRVFLKWTEHPPDAHHGFYVP